MKRIIIICEGQTEQAFVNSMLGYPFINIDIHLQAPVIKATNGGIVNWATLKKQIETHLKSDKEAYVTTFIDYYGLYEKHEFPAWESAQRIEDKNRRMDSLENAMKLSITSEYQHRFIPYIQLHEFEGLLFNEIDVFKSQIPTKELIGIEELQQTIEEYPNPEMINNSRETSPSHRLERIIFGYDKVVYGNILAEAISLERIRAKSPRFKNWLSRLESI